MAILYTSSLIAKIKRGVEMRGKWPPTALIEYPPLRGCEKFLGQIYFVSVEDQMLAAGLQERLRELGRPMSAADLVVAAACVNRGEELITRDEDFLTVREACEGRAVTSAGPDGGTGAVWLGAPAPLRFPRRGGGAGGAPHGRFLSWPARRGEGIQVGLLGRVPAGSAGDGWRPSARWVSELPGVEVKSVLNKHGRRDSWFLDEYSVNPYYGCPLSCVYCYTRGTRYGRGRPGEVRAKVNAPEVLARQLRTESRAGRRGFIALGTATEPYMPFEAELGLTRRCLEVISSARFPVHVLTKSDLVLRDADLLAEASGRAILPPDLRGRVPGAVVTVSVSTLDPEVAGAFEPGAPPPSRRLEVVRRLSELGVAAGVAFIPVLPGISDGEGEIDRMVEAAASAGAAHVFVGALTVPGDVRGSVEGLVYRRFPELLRTYRELFSRGPYPPRGYQARLDRAAREACRRHGVRYMLL